MTTSPIARFLDWIDHPRFCPDDGKPIIVTDVGEYDDRTGERRERWVWSCPEVHVSVGGGGATWSQTGDRIHVHGFGRPRWHARLSAE